MKENIEYDHLRKNLGYDYELLDEILEILVDTVCSTRKMIRIGGEDFPKEVVKSRLLKLDSSHIEYVISSLRENTTKVRNIRAYLAALDIHPHRRYVVDIGGRRQAAAAHI